MVGYIVSVRTATACLVELKRDGPCISRGDIDLVPNALRGAWANVEILPIGKGSNAEDGGWEIVVGI